VNAQEVFAALKLHGLKLATAESCTGGMIAAAITDIPGSSHVFDRGFVTYSNDAKFEMLGVPPEMIQKHGAVSEDVARAMADGALRLSKADIAVSVTGIAGPTGGSVDKPVGLVWIAVSTRAGNEITAHETFGSIGRMQIRNKARDRALELVLAMLNQSGRQKIT
jgi:nicotinamide-nucleotide amidase